nr:GntR family transcriptional regulator [Deinococcus peraridilitoris]
MFERPTLVRDEVYQHLRSAILQGEFSPGEKLGEAELVARLGVSRTPIREAVQRLVQEGLLEASANRGVWVRQIGAREARDTYAVRETLDGLAAELAALEHREDDAQRLREALELLDDAGGDYREQTRLDLAFHREVVRASHNVALADLARSLEQRVALIKHLTRTYNAHPQTSQQHHAILNAVLARDAAGAQAAARLHVRTFAELALRDLPSTEPHPSKESP